MMPELKPCPFCGGKAEIVFMSEKFTVSCASGGCMANIAWCPDEEKAARAWNRRASDWIPCSERLPEDGERILICVHLASHESVQLDTCIEDGGYMYLDSGYSFGKEVTHWMPLPTPPKEED